MSAASAAKAHPRPRLEWVRPPLQERSQKTLERMLDAGEALISEKGFDQASVSEIARRAKSSVGAFYSRFPDKDSLLQGLHERFLQEALATADVALEPSRWEGAGPEEFLEEAISFLLSIRRRHAGLIRAIVLKAGVDPSAAGRTNQFFEEISRRFSAFVLSHWSGRLTHPQPVIAAEFCFRAIVGMLALRTLFSDASPQSVAFEREVLASELARVCKMYLFAPALRPFPGRVQKQES